MSLYSVSEYATLNQQISKLTKKIGKLESNITDENREKVEKKVASLKNHQRGLMTQKNAIADLISRHIRA